MHIKCDLKSFDFTSFGTKFDVIHIDPPLLEYQVLKHVTHSITYAKLTVESGRHVHLA